MSNMSYCRYQNTLTDLRDCWASWGDNENELSESERKAKERLLELCKEITEEAM